MQQRVLAPNVASAEEFPSFGDTPGAGPGSAPAWGPRR